MFAPHEEPAYHSLVLSFTYREALQQGASGVAAKQKRFWHASRVFAGAALLTVCVAAHTAQPLGRAELLQQDRLAVDHLQGSFDPARGLWAKQGWWHDANSLTAVIDFSRVAGTKEYLPAIERTYAANIDRHFLINKFYDDEGWWALAWIDGYDLTGEKKYLAAAAVIFQDMLTGWDDTCGGGVWWTRDRKYKNAIPNELFLKIAASLALRADDAVQRQTYADWADREWTWLRQSPMLESDHLFADGLNEQCQDNHRTKWSYNQGVVLGGLAQLSQLPGHAEALHEAQVIADAAMTHLAGSNGILQETCEPTCGGDGSQFKGIFMRNLGELTQHTGEQRAIDFLHANAKSILNQDEAPDGSFGVVWSGPVGKTDTISSTSAVDALTAALAVTKP